MPRKSKNDEKALENKWGTVPLPEGNPQLVRENATMPKPKRTRKPKKPVVPPVERPPVSQPIPIPVVEKPKRGRKPKDVPLDMPKAAPIEVPKKRASVFGQLQQIAKELRSQDPSLTHKSAISMASKIYKEQKEQKEEVEEEPSLDLN